MGRSSRQRIKKGTALYDTSDQLALKDIFGTFHSKATVYKFFSSIHGSFSNIDHVGPQNKS